MNYLYPFLPTLLFQSLQLRFRVRWMHVIVWLFHNLAMAVLFLPLFYFVWSFRFRFIFRFILYPNWVYSYFFLLPILWTIVILSTMAILCPIFLHFFVNFVLFFYLFLFFLSALPILFRLSYIVLSLLFLSMLSLLFLLIRSLMLLSSFLRFRILSILSVLPFLQFSSFSSFIFATPILSFSEVSLEFHNQLLCILHFP